MEADWLEEGCQKEDPGKQTDESFLSELTN